MISHHLTDKEIQQLALDNPAADISHAGHLQFCEECRAKLEAYQLLFANLKDQPAPAFDFNLEQLVLEQLPKPKEKPHVEKRLSHLLIAISVLFTGIIVFVLKDYLLSGDLLLVFLVVIVTIPVLLFLVAGMYKGYQKKMKMLDYN